jgi:anti-sigma factor RsiW
MTRCEEIRVRMIFYLDDELEQNECTGIQAHLDSCGACRALFQSERRFLQVIRGFRPLRLASPELRAHVEKLINDRSAAPVAPAELRQRIGRSLWQVTSRTSGLLSARHVVALAALVGVALAISFWHLSKRSFPLRFPATSEFAMMAADTHQRHIHGQLPLEIVSDAPEQISAWFAGKVPFLLKLPNYQESSGQEKLYNLEGARLVAYRSDYAAYVAYQMRTRPISLVVTSDAVAQASDGEQVVAKGITFHYNSINGLKVITWSDRGLTYALVSDLDERGQQSCVVCHQGTKDRDFIESLKPR